jgi:hypothetical protein
VVILQPPLRWAAQTDQSGESVPFTSTRRTVPIAKFPLLPPEPQEARGLLSTVWALSLILF